MRTAKPVVLDDQVDVLARVMNSEQRKSYGRLQENDAAINRDYAEKLVAGLKRVGYQITKRSETPAPVRDSVLRCSACGHISL
jgi:hypothetical protein